jgi:DnaK suppressor protein
MLTPQDVRRFHERLEAERAAIESRIAETRAGIQETVEADLGVGDSGDESEVLYERETDIYENAHDREKLEQVNRALRRIEEGTYGISEISGKPIPKERLEAVPYATTLVDERPPELA